MNAPTVTTVLQFHPINLDTLVCFFEKMHADFDPANII